MITPKYLQKGDKIGIVAPAGKVRPEAIMSAMETFREWGLNVVTGNYLFNEHFRFSGTIEERIEDFQNMLDDESIKAIICARGGYGVTHIIDQLDFTNFCKNPKWIVGFSDITLLHLHILKNFGIETIHGIMPNSFLDSDVEQSIDSLRKALFGEELQYSFKSNEYNITGQCKGEITGGNLSLIASTIGTSSEIITYQNILFFEEINEDLYKIDRILSNLQRSGKLTEIKAVVVGSIINADDDPKFGESFEEIVLRYFENEKIPICFNFPAGHSSTNNAIILGREISLSVSKENVTVCFLKKEFSKFKKKTFFKNLWKPAIYFLSFFLLIWILMQVLKIFK